MPSARAKTLADPPGTTASAGRGDPRAPGAGRSPVPPVPCSMPLATSLTVPSPPWATSSSTPSRTAWAVASAACPRYRVTSTSSLSSLASAWARTSRPAAVVEVALGFTTSSARTPAL